MGKRERAEREIEIESENGEEREWQVIGNLFLETRMRAARSVLALEDKEMI